MSRFRRSLSKVALVAAGISLSAFASAKSEKPNIILIISDDQRWDTIGDFKSSALKTPNLDKLVKESLYFPQATIHVSICSPSRAALLTGLTSHQNGWYTNESQIPAVLKEDGFAQYDLLPTTLSKAGYHTAQVGKWHVKPLPWKTGFETIGTWFAPGAGKFFNANLSEGKTTESKPSNKFTQTAFADSAIDIIKKHDQQETTRPLFLWFAFTASHTPYVPNPKPFSKMYEKDDAEDLRPKTFNSAHGTTEVLPHTDWTKYYEAITAMDHEVGRIVDTVKESSLSTNTIIIFQGDNGYMMGSHQLIGKGVPHEASLRVPFFVWGPKHLIGAAGQVTDANVSSLDVPPTIAALAGAEIPKSWAGRNISKVLADGKSHDITWAISEYAVNNDVRYPDNGFRVVRTNSYKLILWHPDAGKEDELYNIADDPNETKNLISDKSKAGELARLKAIYEDWKIKTNDSWDVRGPVATRHAPDSPKAKRLNKKRQLQKKEKQERQKKRAAEKAAV